MPHETEIIIRSRTQPVAFGEGHHNSDLPKPKVQYCVAVLVIIGLLIGLAF